jgi:hemoglobin
MSITAAKVRAPPMRLCAALTRCLPGRYHGQPMQAHFPLSIEPAHFDRWLALFERTVSDVCPPAAAAVFMEKARRIADSFEMAIAGRRGEIAGPRHSRSLPTP